MKWMKFLLIIILFSLLFISSNIAYSYSTPQCNYGVFDCWFSLDGINWTNTTVDYVELQLGQPFYLKTFLKTLQDNITVDFYLTETGEYNANGSTFNVISGPGQMFEIVTLGVVKEEDYIWEDIWKLCVKNDTDWVNGNAPLNVYAQFGDHTLDYNNWQSDSISFTAVNIYVNNEIWNESLYNKASDSYDSSLLFQISELIFLITLIIISKKFVLN
jgi:hypothetical protein